MTATIVETLSLNPETMRIEEGEKETLANALEELVRLRFSILLTARWEATENEDAERRRELRAELIDLRRHYSDEIDEIAMTFGVQQAMDAKAQVERNVFLPQDETTFGLAPDEGFSI